MKVHIQFPTLFILFFIPAVSVSAATARFTLTSDAPEAVQGLVEVQQRIEDFQFGPETIEVARKIVEADPAFAMGHYYISALVPPPENQTALERAVQLSENASEGERRFIQAMAVVRAGNGTDFQKGIPLLEELAADYPDERLVFVILGQLYQAVNDRVKARKAFEKAQQIGPVSNRIRSFLANDDLLSGSYASARETFMGIEKDLPAGSLPFAVRYGTAFSYLYEGDSDSAIQALERYQREYLANGANQNFPEVFILNSIARIHLENGRLEDAMAAYLLGYESVPKSTLPEDQKELWLGRLHHGKCRVLAKMGKHDEAWAEAETIRRMIEDGGEGAQQYLPAYHYLLGYLMLEKGDFDQAIVHLKQADPSDPFHNLLLARAHKAKGDTESAKKAYQAVVDSPANGLERALAMPEARRELSLL